MFKKEKKKKTLFRKKSFVSRNGKKNPVHTVYYKWKRKGPGTKFTDNVAGNKPQRIFPWPHCPLLSPAVSLPQYSLQSSSLVMGSYNPRLRYCIPRGHHCTELDTILYPLHHCILHSSLLYSTLWSTVFYTPLYSPLWLTVSCVFYITVSCMYPSHNCILYVSFT